MAEAPIETKIHFEFASFAGNSTLSEIKENILPYTDSIGMNEQDQRFVIKRKYVFNILIFDVSSLM